MKSKFIFLRDPWNDVKNHDSGWGNRLVSWEAASIVNRAMGNTHTIKVLPSEFPELFVVHLPNTEYITSDDDTFLSIDESEVSKWVKQRKINLSKDFSYTTNYNFKTCTEIIKHFHNEKTDLVSKIRLKDENLSNKLQSYMKNRVGIHIRRGNGVYIDNDDKFTIPRGYMKYYNLCTECDKKYTFIRDEIYYDLLDKFIKKDRNVDFFIGIDVNEKAIDYFKEKYPGRIITCNDIIKFNKEIIKESKILTPRLQLVDIGKILIDFFSLAFCKQIIPSPSSSWSYMASRILGSYSSFSSFEHIPSDALIHERKRIELSNNTKDEYKKPYVLKSNIL